MTENSQTHNDIIPLELPSRDGSGGYNNLFLRYFNLLAAIIADNQTNDIFRIDMMINLMINSVPDDDTRDKLRTLKSELIKEKSENITHDLSAYDKLGKDQKDQVSMESNMEVLGEVMGYFDTYIGNTKKISVSIEAVFPDSHYQAELDTLNGLEIKDITDNKIIVEGEE